MLSMLSILGIYHRYQHVSGTMKECVCIVRCSVSGGQSLIIDPLPWHHGGSASGGDQFQQAHSVSNHGPLFA